MCFNVSQGDLQTQVDASAQLKEGNTKLIDDNLQSWQFEPW